MRKISQIELLDEGFWDNFKGVARAGAHVARMVAPEITDPLDKLQNAFTGTKNAFKLGKAGVPSDANTRPITTSEIEQFKNKSEDETANLDRTVMQNMKMGLQKSGYTMLPMTGVYLAGVDPKNGGKLYHVMVSDRQNTKLHTIINTQGIIFTGTLPNSR